MCGYSALTFTVQLNKTYAEMHITTTHVDAKNISSTL